MFSPARLEYTFPSQTPWRPNAALRCCGQLVHGYLIWGLVGHHFLAYQAIMTLPSRTNARA